MEEEDERPVDGDEGGAHNDNDGDGKDGKKKRLTKRLRAHSNPFTPPAKPPPLTPDHVEWAQVFKGWQPGSVGAFMLC